MAVMDSAGADRARFLLNGVPERFNDFCHMDQRTFVQLADWLMAHAESSLPPEISVEESLFVFLDIVAQGSSFTAAGHGWGHDVELTQNIFVNILNALQLLREKEDISPQCPAFNTTKGRWRVLRAVCLAKLKTDGLVKIGGGGGGGGGDGLDISQESLTSAITALNNFILEHRDL